MGPRKAQQHAGGAPRSSRIRIGPRAQDHYVLDFPWELTNQDYLRRVLQSVAFALKPVYLSAIRPPHNLAPQERNHKGKRAPVPEDDLDLYYILTHMEKNTQYYARRLFKGNKAALNKAITELRDSRNAFAHFGPVRQIRFTYEYLTERFQNALCLAKAARVPHVLANLTDLEAQFRAHYADKARRKAGGGGGDGRRGNPPARRGNPPVRRGKARGAYHPGDRGASWDDDESNCTVM